MVQPPSGARPSQPPFDSSGSAVNQQAAQIQWEIGVLSQYLSLINPSSSIQKMFADIQQAEAGGASPTQLAQMVNALINQVNTSGQGPALPNFQFGSDTNSDNYVSYAQTLITFIKQAESEGDISPTNAKSLISQLQNFQNSVGNVPPYEAALQMNDIILYLNDENYKYIVPPIHIP